MSHMLRINYQSNPGILELQLVGIVSTTSIDIETNYNQSIENLIAILLCCLFIIHDEI